MTSMVAMVEIKGCILNLAVKKPAIVVKMVHRMMQTTRARNTRTTAGMAGEVEDVAEHAAGIGAGVHHDGGRCYAHTHHTADGQVGTGQQDEPRHAQSQKHSGRGLGQDIEHVVYRQQLRVGPLDNGGNDTQLQ